MLSQPHERIVIRWRPRILPLEPAAAAGRGAAAQALARRLLQLKDPELRSLRGLGGRGCLLVIAAESGPAQEREPALPWVDGIEYLGVHPEVHGLLVPTASEPLVPVSLLVEGLRRRGIGLPLALLVARGPAAVDLAAARPLARGALNAWLEGAA